MEFGPIVRALSRNRMRVLLIVLQIGITLAVIVPAQPALTLRENAGPARPNSTSAGSKSLTARAIARASLPSFAADVGIDTTNDPASSPAERPNG